MNISQLMTLDTCYSLTDEVRGDSVLLRFKVEQEMPFLNVTITRDEGRQSTVLQGQTSRWKLILSNLGHAPAGNILLKTNSPWIDMNQLSDGATESNEHAPTSLCIGPSGTLMKVPLTKETTVNKSVPSGVLRPGDTVEIPVAIRASGGGRQDFYMLFRYELWNDERKASRASLPRRRWARKLLSVPVFPSITMSASLMPSYSNKGDHILSLEVRTCLLTR